MDAIHRRESITLLLLAASAACTNANPAAPRIASAPIDSTPSVQEPLAPASVEAVGAQDVAPLSIAPETAVPEAPMVRVLDQNGRPMAGVVVHFVPRGGSVAATLVKSDSSGRASCGQWIAGTTEGPNWLYANVAGVQPVVFHALVLLPDPPGVRYDLRSRQGAALSPAEAGHLVLTNDGKFRLVYLWSLGTSTEGVVVNTGTYIRLNEALAFSSVSFGTWAFGEMKEDLLTFRYDDYLDTGFHVIVIETYELERDSNTRRLPAHDRGGNQPYADR